MPNVNLTHSQLGSTTWSPDTHRDLALPDGKTAIGTCPTEQLRVWLAPFVQGAHTRPRLEIIQDYAAQLKSIFDSAGDPCSISIDIVGREVAGPAGSGLRSFQPPRMRRVGAQRTLPS
jgi:hypothetical protein